MSEQSGNIDKARSVLSDDSDARHEDVHHNGAVFRVQELSLADQTQAKTWATIRVPASNGKGESNEVDDFKRGVAMVILCTFDPDSGKRIFEKQHIDSFMRKRGSTLLKKLMSAMKRVNEVTTVEEAVGNSESAPTDSSSTN
jgi:hypothetical protein